MVKLWNGDKNIANCELISVAASQTDLNMFDTPVAEKNFECHIFPLCYYASKSLRNRKSCNNACKSSAAAAIHADDRRIIFIIVPKSLMCTASMWGLQFSY